MPYGFRSFRDPGHAWIPVAPAHSRAFPPFGFPPEPRGKSGTDPCSKRYPFEDLIDDDDTSTASSGTRTYDRLTRGPTTSSSSRLYWSPDYIDEDSSLKQRSSDHWEQMESSLIRLQREDSTFNQDMSTPGEIGSSGERFENDEFNARELQYNFSELQLPPSNGNSGETEDLVLPRLPQFLPFNEAHMPSEVSINPSVLDGPVLMGDGNLYDSHHDFHWFDVGRM